MTPLLWPKYIHIKLSDVPDIIIQQYGFCKTDNKYGMIHMAVSKGMYGLPQSGLIANELLENGSRNVAMFKANLSQTSGNTAQYQ